jgi:hypothetical protein
MNVDNKHLEHVYGLQASEYAMKWYGWGSPVGLSIFFLTLTIIGIMIRYAFLLK